MDGAAHLGEGGKQQVGADGQVGFHAEKKNQHRCHEVSRRPPRQSHDEAHGKTSENECKFRHGRDCRGHAYQTNDCFVLPICE